MTMHLARKPALLLTVLAVIVMVVALVLRAKFSAPDTAAEARNSQQPVAPSVEDHADEIDRRAERVTSQKVEIYLQPFDIDARVANGEVQLRGAVDSEVERDLAGELATGMEGIDEVDNQLTVRTRPAPLGDGDDATAKPGYLSASAP